MSHWQFSHKSLPIRSQFTSMVPESDDKPRRNAVEAKASLKLSGVSSRPWQLIKGSNASFLVANAHQSARPSLDSRYALDLKGNAPKGVLGGWKLTTPPIKKSLVASTEDGSFVRRDGRTIARLPSREKRFALDSGEKKQMYPL